MRRRTLLVALAGLAVLVAVGVVVLWPGPDRITRANFQRIKQGMRRAEVEAILGPPGDYRTGPMDMFQIEFGSDFEGDAGLWVRWASRGYVAEPGMWLSDEAQIYLVFDREDAVRHMVRLSGKLVDSDPLDNLLWRAKRQWRRWIPE
jgi:hypothetical protein